MFKRVICSCRIFTALCVFLFISNFTFAGQIIYVDKDASNMNTGSSWERAKKCLQEALTNAKAGDEIRVAQGIYKPDESFESGRFPKIVSSGNRSSTFQLKSGVTIKGGYAGYGEPDPDARDICLYETILSGDLDGNDVEVNDPCDLSSEPTRAKNSRHVIKSSSSVDETAILDGFTITAGYADKSPDSHGGGMYNLGNPIVMNCTFADNYAYYGGGGVGNSSSNPEFINCIFKNNYSYLWGGGVDCDNNSNSIFTNCKFNGNNARNGAGACITTNNSKFIDCSFNNNKTRDNIMSGLGAGLYTTGNDISLINCTFFFNEATGSGGGIYNGSANMMLNRCKFIVNTANNGAGLYNYYAGAVLTGCTFSANSVSGYGGGVCNSESDISLTNCVFYRNSGIKGNALAVNIYTNTKKYGIIKINNCILWDGGNEIYDGTNSNITVTYSDVQGSSGYYECIDAEPCFVSMGYWDANDNLYDLNDDFWVEGDYHLKSQAGRFDVNTQSWVYDDVTSPCIDTGDPLTPIGYEPYPNRGIINMGIYGGTEQASMSLYDVNSFPKSYAPNPPDYAVDVNLDYDLTWSSDANAAVHEIYFGTSDTPQFISKGYSNKFDPGVLLPNTQYYWRVDNLDNMSERTIGDTWTFLTGPEPYAAYNPIPENRSDNVLPNTLLNWIPGVDAFLHTIYLDTDYDKVHDANIYNIKGVKYFSLQNSTYYNPGMLEPNQTYYWRVDEQDNSNYTRGHIWTFKTGSIPLKAYNPNPENGAVKVRPGIVNVEESEMLSWSPGFNAVRHDVYFGTNYSKVTAASITNKYDVLVSIGQEPNFYQPNLLEYNKVYYWRIDGVDGNGITIKGDVWNFTTETHPPKSRCFTGNTKVWIDGKAMEISKAVVGQKTSINDRIEQPLVHEGTFILYDIMLESGNCITVADNHYFLTESGKWMSLHNLKAGMKLKTSKNSIDIKSIKKNPVPFTGKVYNLKIDGSDQYMVGEDAVIVSDY